MGRLSSAAHFLSLYIALTLLGALVSPTLAQPTKSAIPATVTEINGYPFPPQLAGLPRLGKTDFHSSQWGFSVRYGNSRTWADIYVYDGNKDLASAAPRKAAMNELQSALKEISSSVEAGGYDDAKLVDTSESNGFAKAHLTITQQQRTRASYVFITVRKANFVKIRLTTSEENSDRLADKLLKDYAKLLGI